MISRKAQNVRKNRTVEKNDVLEEWNRLAERIAHVPTYEFGEPFTPWEQEERKRVRWYTTTSADGKPVQGNFSNLIL